MNRIDGIKRRLKPGSPVPSSDVLYLLSNLEIAEKALEEIYDCGSRKQAEIISRDTLKKIRGEEE